VWFRPGLGNVSGNRLGAWMKLSLLFVLLLVGVRAVALPVVDLSVVNTMTDDIQVVYYIDGQVRYSDIPAGQTVLIYAQQEIAISGTSVVFDLSNFEEHEKLRGVVSGPINEGGEPLLTVFSVEVNVWVPFAAGMGAGFMFFGFGWSLRLVKKVPEF